MKFPFTARNAFEGKINTQITVIPSPEHAAAEDGGDRGGLGAERELPAREVPEPALHGHRPDHTRHSAGAVCIQAQGEQDVEKRRPMDNFGANALPRRSCSAPHKHANSGPPHGTVLSTVSLGDVP